MPVNPRPDERKYQTATATIPVTTLAAMALGAIVLPIVAAVVAVS